MHGALPTECKKEERLYNDTAAPHSIARLLVQQGLHNLSVKTHSPPSQSEDVLW